MYHNELTINDTVNLACAEIKRVFFKEKLPLEKDRDIGFFGDVIGKCPLCGSEVTRTRYTYGCRNYKECSFKINTTICGRVISKENVKLILQEGKSSKIEGFTSKNGKEFSARLKLENGSYSF